MFPLFIMVPPKKSIIAWALLSLTWCLPGLGQYGFTSLSPLPEPGRDDACIFAFEDYLYVTGGGGDGFFLQGDLWRYHLLSDTWDELGGFPGAPRQYSYVGVIEDTAYLIGGLTKAGDPLNELWSYQIVSDSWSQLDSLPAAGRYKGVGFTYENRLYYGTGRGDDSSFSDFWVYDPLSATWTELPSLPSDPRNEACSFVIGDKAYIAGGLTLDSPYLSEVWALDIKHMSWERTTDLPHPLAWAEAACNQNGSCAIWDGKYSTESMAGEVLIVNTITINGETDLVFQTLNYSGPSIRNSSVCALGGWIFRFGGKDSLDNKSSALTKLGFQESSNTLIYPNPSYDRVHIQAPEPWTSLKIADLQGRNLHEVVFGRENRLQVLDIGHLLNETGCYMLLIDGREAKRLIYIQDGP